MTDPTPTPAATPMNGRTVLVTGATAGIGRATAQGLARLGAHVVVHGRDRAKTGRVVSEIQAATGNPGVEPIVADLGSFAEIRRLAAEFTERHGRLHVLVNNAGAYWTSRHTTADGLERTFAVNHLAPFLLTNLLLDVIKNSGRGRIVTVSSGAQAIGRIDFDDLQGARRYGGQRAYNQSKLANVMFTYELARRLEGSDVTANVLHPGVVRSNFGMNNNSRLWSAMTALGSPFMKTTEQGAATSIYLASSAEVEGVTAGYFVNSRQRRSSKASYDTEAARRLWQVSAGLVGLTAELAGDDGR